MMTKTMRVTLTLRTIPVTEHLSHHHSQKVGSSSQIFYFKTKISITRSYTLPRSRPPIGDLFTPPIIMCFNSVSKIKVVDRKTDKH